MTLQELRDALADRRPRVRGQAVRDASDDPPAGMLAVIVAAMGDPDPSVRRTIVCAIGRMGVGQNVLEQVLANNPSADLRSAAAKWLAKNHWSQAALDQAAENDLDDGVRRMARVRFP